MKIVYCLLAFCLSLLLSSCEFNCSIGKKEEVKGSAKVKEGARVYNNIQLTTNGVKVDKAFLLLANGQRVPDDNFVDFNGTVKMQIYIDSGWTVENGKVRLGASEKIIAENGDILVDEPDMFQKYADGLSVEDAKSMYLSAILEQKKDAPPTSVTVAFKIWDKMGTGFVEGTYQLFSR